MIISVVDILPYIETNLSYQQQTIKNRKLELLLAYNQGYYQHTLKHMFKDILQMLVTILGLHYRTIFYQMKRTHNKRHLGKMTWYKHQVSELFCYLIIQISWPFLVFSPRYLGLLDCLVLDCCRNNLSFLVFLDLWFSSFSRC